MLDTKNIDGNENENKRVEYLWWRDSSLINLILLFVVIILFTFSFLKMPALTFIHGNTVGLLFGHISTIFYLYIGSFAVNGIFKNKFNLPKWIKLTKSKFWFLYISISFISVSSGYYQEKIDSNNWLSFGADGFKVFSTWWDDFRSNDDWLYPSNSGAGIIGALLYAITTSATTGIGSLIIAIFMLAISTSLFFTGSATELFKRVVIRKNRKKSVELAKKKNIPAEEALAQTTELKISNKAEENVFTTTKEISIKEDSEISSPDLFENDLDIFEPTLEIEDISSKDPEDVFDPWD